MPGRRARRFSRIGVAAVALGALTLVADGQVRAVPPPLQSGAPADDYVVSAGADWNVWSPAPGHIANFPQAFATDQVIDGMTRRQVFTYWQITPDDATYASVGMRSISSDGAETFPEMSTTQGSVTSGIRLDDGSLLGVKFLADESQAPTFVLQTVRSNDMGATWTDGTATLDTGKYTLGWIRVHRGIVQSVDGTLLMPMYGVASGETTDSSFLLASTDRGKSWAIRSRISDVDAPGTNEVSIAYTTDGRLVGFLRSNNEKDLLQAYSDDDGRTWSTPKIIVPPDGAPTGLADPMVVLQPNGMLVLSYGRPDNSVLVSRDGTGRTWEDYEDVFNNKPRETWPGSTHGSSGNTALVTTSANQSVVFGDTCGHQWMCREKGQQYRIWAHRIDAVTPGAGKLDLATKVKSGSVTLTGSVLADPAFPETRIQGAVDGSSERYAAAKFRNAKAASTGLVVRLDKLYTLNRIGLMLGYGTPQDADVQLSVDGRHWQSPVVKARKSVDFAVRYRDISPVQARFVKISAPAGGTLDALTELELYSADTMTFENDAVNSAPRGFIDTRYAFVNDTIMPGYDSRRRLSLVDADGDAAATATLPTSPVSAQRLDYAYAATQYASGMRMLIRGTDSSGAAVNPWQFRLVPSGTGFALSAFDGSGWTQVGTTATRPANQIWTTVRIDTTPGRATVTIGGEKITTTVRAAKAASFTGVTFDTDIPNTPVQSGMQHDFDDVQVGPLR